MLHSRHVSMHPKNTTYADTVTEAKLMATMFTSRHKMPVVMRSAPLHMFTIRRVRVNFAVDQSRIVVRGALTSVALGSRVDKVASGDDISGVCVGGGFGGQPQLKKVPELCLKRVLHTPPSCPLLLLEGVTLA